MNNKNLLYVSLGFSLIGIFIIILLAEYTSISSFQIKDITEKQLETKVRISGKITSIRETPSLLILNIEDETGKITAIVFKEESIAITKNMEIEIEGEIQKYENQLEIITDKITSLNQK